MIDRYEKTPPRAPFGLILGDDVRKAPRKILKRCPNMIESVCRFTKRLNKSRDKVVEVDHLYLNH